jgi:hypothetical protein
MTPPVSDDEARQIQKAVDDGTRGPVLIKWLRQLLEDRRERREREREGGRQEDER